MHTGAIYKSSHTTDGEGTRGRRTPGYSSTVRWLKEPGVFNGRLEYEASPDDKAILAGPQEGKLIVTGDKALLVIKGGGEFTLQNIEVNGDLVIHLPTGGVTLLDSVKVAGTTLVIAGEPDGAGDKSKPIGEQNLSFKSRAEHGEEIILLQNRLLNVRLDGKASRSEVIVHLSGALMLGGTYSDVLIAPTASRLRLKLEQGTVIDGALKLMAADFNLDMRDSSVFDFWNDPNLELSGKAAALAENASVKLAAINQSRNAEDLERALTEADILLRDRDETMTLLDQLQSDSCSSLIEVKALLEMFRLAE